MIAPQLVLDPHKLYTPRQVFCDWMGYRRIRWYRDNWTRLEQRGFPLPIPKPGRKLWRGEDLIAWARGEKDIAKAMAEPGSNVVAIAELARARSAALIDARRKAS